MRAAGDELYTPEEIFGHMCRINPLLAELRDKFDLELE